MQSNTNNVNKKICPTCRRQFGDKFALQQHRAAAHGSTITGLQPRNPRVGGNGGRRALVSRVNLDGTTKQAGQSLDEATFGSSAAELVSRAKPTSLGIQEAVTQVIGSTPEGRAWALAALHPCGAGEIVARNVGVVNGMCDTMTSSVATPVYRSETHLSYAQVLFNNAIPSPSTYGIDIIIPPIPEIDFAYRLIDDSTSQKTDWIVVRLPDFALPKVTTYQSGRKGYDNTSNITTMSNVGYGKIRQIAVGHTFELDAAGLNDQGRVVVGQMEGQWRNMPLSVPRVDYQTAQFVTDSTTNPPQKAAAVTNVEGFAPDATSSVWLLEVPTDPGVITSSCPNAYQGLAKHGAYVVQKFTSPLLGYAFKRTGSGEVVLTAGGELPTTDGKVTEPYMPMTSFALATDGSGKTTFANTDGFWSKDPTLPAWSAFGDGISPVAGTATTEVATLQKSFHPGISEPSDMMTSVVMFRNLPAGGQSGITSSVRVKSRNYYEAISNGNNAAVAPYIHPPAQFDFQALNSVIIAGKQLSDAYPASANSLSSILGTIWGALRTYVKPIAKTVGTLDIPVASPIASVLSNLIDHGEDLRRRFR